jgi:fructose-1,6-bisphosphatase I
MADRTTLEDWLEGQIAGHEGGRPLSDLVIELSAAVRSVSAMTRKGELILNAGTGGTLRETLEDGANQVLRTAAQNAPVAHFASEDLDDVLVLDGDAPLALAVDPLDAASGLDANVSTGTIFSIYPKGADPMASFLRPGREQYAAGFAMYGPRTLLVLTLGRGTAVFTLDPDTAAFILTEPALRTPEDADAFAINAANYRHWEPPVRAYIDDCIEGAEGPRRKNFNMRWVASLVSETARILVQGGLFLYPRDDRPGHQEGTLRRVFDAVPIAFIAEQCGGAATNGNGRILDTVPDSLHARAPLVFGSRSKVERLQRYHEDPDFVSTEAPLFGVRGLFRG